MLYSIIFCLSLAVGYFSFSIVIPAMCFYAQELVFQVNSYMKLNRIEVCSYDAISSDVNLLTSNQLVSSLSAKSVDHNGEAAPIAEGKDGEIKKECNLIWMDPYSCYCALYSKLKSEHVFLQQSPLAFQNALKVKLLFSIYPPKNELAARIQFKFNM